MICEPPVGLLHLHALPRRAREPPLGGGARRGVHEDRRLVAPAKVGLRRLPLLRRLLDARFLGHTRGIDRRAATADAERVDLAGRAGKTG